MSRFGAGFVVLGTVSVCAATGFCPRLPRDPRVEGRMTSDAFRLAPSTSLTPQRLKPV